MQCRGFLELAKEAVGDLVNSIFADQAFMELFHKLYCSDEWLSGSTTASIIATLGDYFDDYEKLIELSWFKRSACTGNLRCQQQWGAGSLQRTQHLQGSLS
jgi:exocyst complex component 3